MPTYYKWKSQFAGMSVPGLAQLRELQEGIARLKRMYAERKLWPRHVASSSCSPCSMTMG
jgi:hypothetical protein